MPIHQWCNLAGELIKIVLQYVDTIATRVPKQNVIKYETTQLFVQKEVILYVFKTLNKHFCWNR